MLVLGVKDQSQLRAFPAGGLCVRRLKQAPLCQVTLLSVWLWEMKFLGICHYYRQEWGIQLTDQQSLCWSVRWELHNNGLFPNWGAMAVALRFSKVALEPSCLPNLWLLSSLWFFVGQSQFQCQSDLFQLWGSSTGHGLGWGLGGMAWGVFVSNWCRDCWCWPGW